MKVFLTGATGFLGKHVLEALVQDKRVTEIQVPSRSKKSHPDKKVRIFECDLSDPAGVRRIDFDVDAIVHLAGRYDFRDRFKPNYLHNVVSTLNLLRRLKELGKTQIPFHFASTYAVGQARGKSILREKPVDVLPPRRIPYALSKAMAERAIFESGLPGRIYRLGVLVGASDTGTIEKIDGPYHLMKFLGRIRKIPGVSKVPSIPIPASELGILPLVPVDAAVKVFLAGLFRIDPSEETQIFGVYHSKSMEMGTLIRNIFDEVIPEVRPSFAKYPPAVLRYQSGITGIPANVFEFSVSARQLSNPVFESKFEDCRIPHFSDYKIAFFRGFQKFSESST